MHWTCWGTDYRSRWSAVARSMISAVSWVSSTSIMWVYTASLTRLLESLLRGWLRDLRAEWSGNGKRHSKPWHEKSEALGWKIKGLASRCMIDKLRVRIVGACGAKR